MYLKPCFATILVNIESHLYQERLVEVVRV